MDNRPVLVAPSLLSADPLALGEGLTAIADADLVHLDVMDGHFVPNANLGPQTVKAVCAAGVVPADVHLMVSNPDAVLPMYLGLGADYVSFHIEAAVHAHRLVTQIKESGAKAAVALNPGTPVGSLDAIVGDLDMVLVMSVDPGFGGQRFIGSTIDKLHDLDALFRRRGVRPLVEVDGGVTADNVAAVAAAGADVVVAGSAVYGADDPSAAIATLRSRASLARTELA